tara:strand:- start:2904 stop:4043 length:1140 start_codon:yes stop_codon:yes gene_type:complete
MGDSSDKIISGLEGVLAFESSIAYIDGSAPELSIRGYQIKDIVNSLTFEEMVFLLWNDKLPESTELTDFKNNLIQLREIPSSVMKFLKSVPTDASPMASLRTAVSMIGVEDMRADDISEASILRKAANLTAVLPTLVAAQSRIQDGKDPIEPNPDLDHAANYYYMLQGEVPTEMIRRTLEVTLMLYAEHETNASTFACRVVVGTLSDFYSAIVAGIGAIKGPLHGGAIEDSMKMFEKIGSPEAAPQFVDQALASKQILPGFGHRVYKKGDPRATELGDMAKCLGKSIGQEKWFDIAQSCETHMRNTKGIIPNVDYFAAIVLYLLGFELNIMPNFVSSARIAGWSAHIMEQYSNNRLIRPRAKYTGERGLRIKGEGNHFD